MPNSRENRRFATLNAVFTTFSNLRNLISYYGIFRTTYGRRSQCQQLGDSWEAVGRKLGNRTCGHLGQLVYMHVKILKPEVKCPDAYLHAQKFRNQRYFPYTHTRKNFETRGTQKFRNQTCIKIWKPLPLKIPEPGAVKFYNFFTESY